MKRQVYYIYWIFFKGHIYVGSTINLENRQRQHRYDCFNMLGKSFSLKVYKTLRKCGITKEEINLQVLEITDDITQKECAVIERNWKDLLKADLNTNVPGRTNKESDKIYNENNRESISKRKKIYYQDNKESIKQKTIEYREINKEYIRQQRKDNRQKRKNQKSSQSESLSLS